MLKTTRLLLLFVFVASAAGQVFAGDDDGIVDLNAWRQRKQYEKFAEVLQKLKQLAPPVDHSDWHRGEVVRALEDRLKHLPGGPAEPVSLRDIRRSLDALKRMGGRASERWARMSDEDREKGLREFLAEALERAQGPARTGDVVRMLDWAFTPELRALVLGGAFELAFVNSKGEVTEARFLEQLLRKEVLGHVVTDTYRYTFLRELEPLLEAHLDDGLARAVGDIARAEWLPFDVSGQAALMLHKWGRGELAEGPRTRAPWHVCMALLLGRTAR